MPILYRTLKIVLNSRVVNQKANLDKKNINFMYLAQKMDYEEKKGESFFSKFKKGFKK